MKVRFLPGAFWARGAMVAQQDGILKVRGSNPLGSTREKIKALTGLLFLSNGSINSLLTLNLLKGLICDKVKENLNKLEACERG